MCNRNNLAVETQRCQWMNSTWVEAILTDRILTRNPTTAGMLICLLYICSGGSKSEINDVCVCVQQKQPGRILEYDWTLQLETWNLKTLNWTESHCQRVYRQSYFLIIMLLPGCFIRYGATWNYKWCPYVRVCNRNNLAASLNMTELCSWRPKTWKS